MFGPVRSINDNLRAIGLVKPSAPKASKPVIAESKPAPQAAKPAAAPAKPAAPKAAAPVAQPKDRLSSLLEQVDSLSKEMKATFAEMPTKKTQNVVESLLHIQKVSDSITKKYEWREDARSKNVAELFKTISKISGEMHGQISGGDLTEEDKIKGNASELIRRFVKAIGIVKEEIGVDAQVFQGLVKESSRL